jgi:uncharacterized damage-inducible protein DinB
MSVDRPDPGYPLDEAGTLLGFLEFHRATLLLKTDGLDAGRLAATLGPSTVTLGGLLSHLTFVEHWWLHHVFTGRDVGEPWAALDWDADPDADWHLAPSLTPAGLRASYDAEVARARATVAAAGSLDELSAVASERTGRRFNLRWILVHLVEEYARHNGHADLVRESVDGATGQ